MQDTTQMSKKPFFGLQPWIIWFLGAVFVLYQFMLQTSTSVMIPNLMKAFNIDAEQVGFLSSSFLYAYLIMQVPGGILVDRFGARIVLTLGAVGSSIASLLFAFSTNLHMAEFARLLMGFSSAPAIAATLFLASNWFPVKRFALLVGLTEMLGMLGGVVGESNLAAWVDHFGWRVTLVGCGFIAILLGLLAWVLIRDRPLVDEILTQTEAIETQSLLLRFMQVVRLPQVWLNGLFSGLTFALVTAFAGLWAVPFMQALYHGSLETAAIASSMIFLGVTVGTPILGVLLNVRERRRPLMFYLTLICLLLILVVIYIPGIPLSTMLSLLFTLGFVTSVYIIPFTIVRDITPSTARGTAMGFTNMLCILFGAPLLQPLIGYFLEINKAITIPASEIFTIGNYRLALTVLPICLILALALIPIIRQPGIK